MADKQDRDGRGKQKIAHDDHSVCICFSTTDGLLSRVIRSASKSETSHALITFHSTTLRKVLVMEAVSRGYRLIPWEKWRKDNTLIARYRVLTLKTAQPSEAQGEQPPTNEVLCTALETMAGHLGAGFDFLGLVPFLKLFFKGTRYRIKNKMQSPNQLFCSEAVAKFLGYAGVALPEMPKNMRPDVLLDYVRGHESLFVLHEDRHGLTPAAEEFQGAEGALSRA